MNTEETERAIRELDAVMNFAAQKEQLDKALREKGELAEELERCSTKLEAEKTKSEALQREKERCDEVTKAKQQELDKERLKTSDLTGKLEDLRNLRSTWEGKTLTEVIAFEQKAREDEITRGSEELLKAMKDSWEKNAKPRQVREAAVSEVRRILEVLRTPEPHDFQAAGVDLEVAKIVSDLLAVRIKERAEIEFLHRGKEVSDRMAKSMFDRMKKEGWPKYVEEHVGPNLRELQTQIITTFAKFIEGEFIVPCDKCRTENSLQLTSDGVGELIRGGSILVPCVNEACRDFLGGGHNIKVSLRDLIKARLHLADGPPA